MNLYQVHSSPVGDLDSTSFLMVIPVRGSVRCVEFGAICTDTADANTAAIGLYVVDGAGNANEVAVATGTTAFDQKDMLRSPVDLFLDKANAKYVFNGTTTSETDGIAYLQVKVKTAGTANSNGVLYAVCAHTGAQAVTANANEIIVTA
jgi:hypothetical protein